MLIQTTINFRLDLKFWCLGFSFHFKADFSRKVKLVRIGQWVRSKVIGGKVMYPADKRAGSVSGATTWMGRIYGFSLEPRTSNVELFYLIRFPKRFQRIPNSVRSQDQ
jgi:hypothetical protein